MHNAADLIRQIGTAREALLETVGRLSNRQADFKPEPHVWSVNEKLEHLVLAEVSGVSKIWAAAEGIRAGQPVWTGEHTNAGLPIEEVILRTWKSKEIAPPIATPHIGGPLAYWMEYTRASQFFLSRLEQALRGLELRSVVFPHFISGPLDAGQRLEFLTFHIRRHHAQIQSMMEASDFPRK